MSNKIANLIFHTIIDGDTIDDQNVGEIIVPRVNGTRVATSIFLSVIRRVRSHLSRYIYPQENLWVNVNGMAHNTLDGDKVGRKPVENYWISIDTRYELPTDHGKFALSNDQKFKISRTVMQTIDHELAHISRGPDENLTNIGIYHSEKQPKRRLAYHYRDMEWDANIVSVLRHWQRLSLRQRGEIKTYEQLLNIIDPRLLVYLDPSNLSRRNKFISKLVRNGIILKI